MADQTDYLEKSRALREALKQKASEIEKGKSLPSTSGLLDAQIQEHIQSSYLYCKSNPRESKIHSSNSLMELSSNTQSKQILRNKSSKPLKLPELNKAFLPYFKKPSEFPQPTHKRVKKYLVNFTGIEPKIKKLNKAYAMLTGRN